MLNFFMMIFLIIFLSTTNIKFNDLGGNIIHELKTKRKKFTLGLSKYYFYNYYNFGKNQNIELPKNLILTIYILDSKKTQY